MLYKVWLSFTKLRILVYPCVCVHNNLFLLMPLCLHYVPRKTGLSFESTPSHASLFAENIGLNSVEASLFSEYKLH